MHFALLSFQPGYRFFDLLFETVSAFGTVGLSLGVTNVVFPERDSAEKVGNQIHIPNLIDYIPLPSGYVIQEIKPAAAFVGKTLAEIDLRKNFKVTVLTIKSVSPKLNTLNPSANVRISVNDVLIVFGEVNDIENLDETMNHS